MPDENGTTPWIKDWVLILAGGLAVMGFTLYGIVSDPDVLIQADVRMGPMIAATKILIPLFLTLLAVVMLAKVKKCEKCGKIVSLWRKKTH